MTTEPNARERIHSMLDAARPDRYDPADKTWQSSVIDAVADELTVEEARWIAAERLVSRCEADATKRTNKLLRDVAASGELPIDWFDAADWPLAVSDGERVRLGAAQPLDFENFANRERRAAANEFAARNTTCEGALKVAELMIAQQVKVAGDLKAAA